MIEIPRAFQPYNLSGMGGFEICSSTKQVEIEATVGVIQGNNLGPILFIYLIQAVATTLDKEMRKANIKQANFRSYKRRKDGMFQHNPSLSKATNVKMKERNSNLIDHSMLMTPRSYFFQERTSKEEEN